MYVCMYKSENQPRKAGAGRQGRRRATTREPETQGGPGQKGGDQKTKTDPKDQGRARPRKPTMGSRSGEAGPPQNHRERTEDPRRATRSRAKGQKKNPKDQGSKTASGRQRPKGRKGGGEGGASYCLLACHKNIEGHVPRAGLSQAYGRACPQNGPVPSI